MHRNRLFSKYSLIFLFIIIWFCSFSCISNNPPKEYSQKIAQLNSSPGIYLPPPTGHFNSFVTYNITLGIFIDLVEQPMAMYSWGDDKWVPMLATSWEVDKKNNYFIAHLRQGVKFHDGTEFIADDVLATFYTGYLMNWAVWKYLDRIDAIDKYTVRFHMKVPSSVIDRYILRTYQIRPKSIYGYYGTKVKQFVDTGKTLKSEELKKLRLELDQFRPTKRIGTGPFTVDMKDITESEITLRKFPQYWDIDKIHFDRIKLYNGETPTITPLILAKEIDYATHGFPPATEREFVREGIRIIRPPAFYGPAVAFNHSIYPFNVKEVRQAIAYAINRDEVGYVALGPSAKKQVYMTGFSDNFVPRWIRPAALNRLNRYEYNPAKAAQILTNLGFKKGTDGIWSTDSGQRMEYQLVCVLEYADYAGAAENIALQLNKFGIKVSIRGITAAQYTVEMTQGRFQMVIMSWGVGHPHPHFSYYNDLITYNYVLGQGPGINFPLVQEIKPYGKVDIEDLITRSTQGLDIEKQKDDVEELALIFNEYLPIIPTFERYGNNPVVENVRISSLPQTSPLYSNDFYADSFFTIMLLQGILKPAN
jgi:peptide/nickel transport system substrate-binding protein